MSSDKKKFELDRRSLLKKIMVGTGIVSSTPVDLFITNMMVNFLQQATAHAAGTDPAFQDFKFLSLVLAGGAPRYYWDLPMTPNGNDVNIANPMVTNRFRFSGNNVEAFYDTTMVGDYHMPYTWNANIPTSSGGVVPMKNLAQNMLTIRGIDLQIDSHDVDRHRQVAPIPGSTSLSGLVADKATTPIPAVGRNGGGSYYKSDKGIAYIELGGGDPFSTAMAPFTPLSSMLSINNGSVEAAIDQALIKMSALSEDKNKFLPSTFATRFNAKKMMMRKFGNLNQSYQTLVQKYVGLISRSFEASGSLSLVGVDDRAIPGLGTAPYRVTENAYLTSSDIRNITHSGTRLYQLAEGMAVAEFMLLEGLSSSVNIEVGDFNQAFYESTRNPANNSTSGSSTVNHSVDVHFTGSHVATILFSRYYRAISACLYEMVGKLKSLQTGNGSNLFDKTVMTVTSEFNRIPRVDGSGSDHGWEGSNFTILSGMVDKFTLMGNIRTNDSGDRGTWGLAGPLDELSGRAAIIGNAASTISAMTEVRSPTPNDQSLIFKDSNGKVNLSIKSLKNVA